MFSDMPSPSIHPNDYARKFNNAVELFLAEVPSSLADYLWEPDRRIEVRVEGEKEDLDGFAVAARLTSSHDSALDRYCRVREAREALRTIAQIALTPDRSDEGASCFGFHLRNLSCLRVDERGQVSVRHDPIIEALTEKGVDATRIRICTVCKRVFWAGRMDQFRCSKQCGQIHRVREWRKQYPGTYKPRRILGRTQETTMDHKKGA